MPFKQPRSPYYYVQVGLLPGYGLFPRRSTGLRKKEMARQAERLLYEMVERGLTDEAWYEVIGALQRGEVEFGEVLRAKQSGRLEAFCRRMKAPLLSGAIAEFLKTDPPYVVRLGLRKLMHLVQKEMHREPRLEELSGRLLTLVAHRAKREGGRRGGSMAHNSVIRSVLNSASVLIKFHRGQYERDRVFAEVRFSRKEDRREVSLSLIEIQRLLAASRPEWLRAMVMLALAAGAERGVLLSMRARHVEIVLSAETARYSGRVALEGTKTKARRRTVDMADSVCRVLLPHLEGKAACELVFGGIDAYKMRYWFDLARVEAGLPHLRFHDLRAVFSQAGEEAGIPLTVMQRVMGHASPEMTRSYQWRESVLGADGAEKIAVRLGLVG